ncbi:hypothetical protein C2869_20425 [Saccharobesus litoralis]|uniref:Uncharacterized protein n=1 Tax=Saccharobesus litoralis TaxID=2172099 RepID=A0A2S0VWM0_9ALTE|nr:response regulator [Saccharobesus litoralis]AWB68616.1 hypothetical protein C2869_20425 [Saccharobesus litoralis]
MDATPSTEIFLACCQQIWHTTSDALLLIEVQADVCLLKYANSSCGAQLDFKQDSDLESQFPSIFANKLSVLCIQATSSGSEVRYVDSKKNELVLFPFEVDQQSWVLCRLSNLPSMLAQAEAPKNTEPSAEQDPIPEPSSSTDCLEPVLAGSVLLAEDQLENRQILERLLQRMGLTVVLAKDGEEAVELALMDDFELLILNIQMPVLGGEKALELLRQAGNTTPALAFSANVSEQNLARYQEIGFAAHIAKPIDPQDLVNTVNQYISRPTDVDANQINLSSEEYLLLKRQYISHLPGDVDRLTLAFEQQNWRLASKVAHVIKGSSINFGFTQLSQLASDIENALDDNDNQQARLVLDKLLDEFQRYQLT